MLGVAGAVALEGRAGVVPAPAVQLGDEPVLGPVAVHEVTVDDDVRVGRREAVAFAEEHHRGLELAAGVGRLLLEERGEAGGAGAPGDGGEGGRDVEQELRLGGLDGAGERGLLDGPGEVGEGARDGRDRDPLVDRDVLGREIERRMHADPFALPSPGAADHDVDPAAGRCAQSPQRGAVRVAQHGAGADRPDGSEPVTGVRQPAVPHRVHPAMKGDQPSGLESSPDLPLGRAERVERPRVDHAVVGAGDFRDALIEPALMQINPHAGFMCMRERFAP